MHAKVVWCDDGDAARPLLTSLPIAPTTIVAARIKRCPNKILFKSQEHED